jgi:hypothetical protein
MELFPSFLRNRMFVVRAPRSLRAGGPGLSWPGKRNEKQGVRGAEKFIERRIFAASDLSAFAANAVVRDHKPAP